jgi:propanol-preferring alcohol dehydrogenase
MRLTVIARYFCQHDNSFIGAKIAGPESARRCLDFTLSRNLLPKIHPRQFKLEDLNEMIDLMKAGKVENGRMVVSFK